MTVHITLITLGHTDKHTEYHQQNGRRPTSISVNWLAIIAGVVRVLVSKLKSTTLITPMLRTDSAAVMI
jgi:hypothetical protein